jgi:hypothetical protein
VTGGAPGLEPDPPAPAEASPRRGGLLVPAHDDSRGGVTAILAVAVILRLWQLGAQSLWTDEGSAWFAASLPFRDLIRFCVEKDASPPLFYFLTGIFLRLRDDEFGLRMVSALAATALVWVTYRFARLFADRRAATLAAALMAIAPFQIMYAQEARSYMLVALWTVLSLYLFARSVLLERPGAWTPLVAVTALGLWTQSIFVLGLGVQAVFVVMTPAGRRNLPRWVLAMAIAFALYVPWILLSMSHSDLGSSHWYVPKLHGHASFQVLRALLLGPLSLVTPPAGATTPGLDHILPRAVAWLILLATPLVPLAFVLPQLLRRDSAGAMLRFVLGALVLPLAAVFVVSFWRPLWLVRYFVFLTPMVAILVAAGVRGMRPRSLSMAWFALLLVVNGYATFRYYIDYSKEPWRAAAARIAADSDPSHTAVIVTFDPEAFGFYNRKLPQPYSVFAAAHPDVPFHDAYTPGQLDTIEQTLRDSTARFDETWVVVRSPNSPVRKEIVRRALSVAAIGREGVLADSLPSVQGRLMIHHYRRLQPHTLAADPSAADTLRVTPSR